MMLNCVCCHAIVSLLPWQRVPGRHARLSSVWQTVYSTSVIFRKPSAAGSSQVQNYMVDRFEIRRNAVICPCVQMWLRCRMAILGCIFNRQERASLAAWL